MSTALTIAGSQDLTSEPSDFGEEHKRIVRDAFAAGASPAEFEMLWLGAKSRGLDPVRRQIHFVKRWDDAKSANVWSSQTSIDGFRAIAESTGLYDGQDKPVYELDDRGGVLSVEVAVYRKDISRPFVGLARWSEFVQTKKDKSPTYMWIKMPFHMLAKCAEALALRKAFPEKLAGLYTNDEMGSDEPDASPLPPRTVDLRTREVPPQNDAPALPASTPTHHIDGDAAFAAAQAPALLGLLSAARSTGDGAAAEQAFAGRVAVLFGTADAVEWDGLKALCTAAALADDSPARRTIARAMKASDSRLGPR